MRSYGQCQTFLVETDGLAAVALLGLSIGQGQEDAHGDSFLVGLEALRSLQNLDAHLVAR